MENDVEAVAINNFENKKIAILDILSSSDYRPLKISELSYLLSVEKDKKTEFANIITALVQSGDIYVGKNNKLQLPEKLNIYRGVFSATTRGFGFVRISTKERDIFIPKDQINNAMHKDTVLVKLGYDNGEIIKIIERGFTTIVGTVEKNGSSFLLYPSNHLLDKIFIPVEQSKNLVEGHKVLAEITKYPKSETSKNKPILAQAKILEILGHANDPGVDILSIIKEAGIPTDFSEKVLEEANIACLKGANSENRTDFRELDIVTIDGEDAKDLDDGISLSYENGIYKLGVHIADVSHYVKHGSELDKEAVNRGTSVYLVDRVIPMLPHNLSNGICSLTAGEDRLALSLIMEINEIGKVISHSVYESIIHVNKRMTYTDVAKVLSGENVESYEVYTETLKTMERLANILNKNRVKRGALDFGINEARIIVDKEGNVTDIVIRERNIATSIIEEFMLCANETIATEYYWLQAPFIYRNHAEPEREKIESLNLFISPFGYRIKGSTTHSKDFQAILKKIEGTKEEPIISHVILRSLKQANYSEDSQGHFGLATRYYCHFTSPIRRYPDLFIHRVIKAHINGKSLKRFQSISHDISISSSKLERRAESAERDVLSYKKAQYMEDKVGQVFNGIISSVTSWGIYVSLSNTIEGMVKISDLFSDVFTYNKEKHKYIGVHTNKIYSLGDDVNVQVISAREGKVDFIFTD